MRSASVRSLLGRPTRTSTVSASHALHGGFVVCQPPAPRRRITVAFCYFWLLPFEGVKPATSAEIDVSRGRAQLCAYIGAARERWRSSGRDGAEEGALVPAERTCGGAVHQRRAGAAHVRDSTRVLLDRDHPIARTLLLNRSCVCRDAGRRSLTAAMPCTSTARRCRTSSRRCSGARPRDVSLHVRPLCIRFLPGVGSAV